MGIGLMPRNPVSLKNLLERQSESDAETGFLPPRAFPYKPRSPDGRLGTPLPITHYPSH